MHKEAREAAQNFEAEFRFSKRKVETMIHRFPAALGDEMRIKYPSMVVPSFVAIGPYHHDKKHLQKMEMKSTAVYYLCQRIGVTPDALRALFAAAVLDEALSKYHNIAVDDNEDDDGTMTKGDMADMMLRDACFLLLFMDDHSHSRSYGYGNEEGFLFSHYRDSIINDILLLENQLPWLVIQFLLDLASQEQIKKDLLKAVGKFVAAMGNSFKILVESSKDDLVAYKWDDDKDPPAHLLDLLRRHKTEKPDKSGHCHCSGTTGSVGNRNATVVVQLDDDDDDENSTRHLRRPLIVLEKPQLTAMSPMDLEEMGIKLTASRTAAFSDMGLEKGWLLSRLTLSPLSLSDTRASCLVNMAALEVCTPSSGTDDRTAVCSYLALLASFMVGPDDDVRRLRSMGLLDGPQGDGDMVAFFSAVVRHLPDFEKRFALVMAEIEEYGRKRRVWTTVYRWVYRYCNWTTIFALLSTTAALIGFYKAFVSLIPTN